MGQPEKSIAIFGRIDPPPPPADIARTNKMQGSIQRAQRIIKAGTDLDQAIRALDEAELGLAPGAKVPRKWRLTRAEAYLVMNNSESLSEARRICISISSEAPLGGDVLTLHGRVSYAEDEMVRALKYFREALEYDETRQDAKNWISLVEKLVSLKKRGNSLFSDGRFAEARDVYTDALAMDSRSKPMSAKLFGNRAQCNIRLGNNETAIADCDAAIRLDPNYVKVRRTKGTALHNCGRYEEMLQVLEEAQRLDPADKATVQNIKIAKAALAQRSQHRGGIDVDDLFAQFKNHNVSG